MDRREFLKYLGASGLVVGTSGWLVERLWALHQEGALPRDPDLAVESYVKTVCTQCGGGCGLRVRQYHGMPVHLAGDPASPISQGGLCPLGTGGLLVLYHPDRVQSPLQRVGERGRGQWKPISWNEALRTLQDRLRGLRDRGEAHRLALIDGGYGETSSTVIARFVRAFGSPNYIRQPNGAAGQMMPGLSQSGSDVIGYDFANARFVLSFGFNYLDADGSPVWQTKAYGKLRTHIPKNRGTFVHIEPRLSITASQADRWIPVRPGSEGMVALGLAHVLIRDGLYDAKFVERYVAGFDDWTDADGVAHMGFRMRILKQFTPEAVSKSTGIAVFDLEQVAHAFASDGPSVAIAGPGVTSHTNGLSTQFAVHTLNVLMGRIGRPGGILPAKRPPFTPLPELKLDATARKGLKQPALAVEAASPSGVASVETLVDKLDKGGKYTLDTLLIHESNPAFDTLNARLTKRVLGRIPFIVSFASFIDDTTQLADLVLPNHTYLERWDDVSEVPGIGWEHIAIQRPVVEPLFDTRHTGQLVLDLARALGDATARAFPPGNFVDLLKFRVRGVFDAKRGRIYGVQAKPTSFATFEDFWAALVEHGGWSDEYRYPAKPTFQTPSGKFELGGADVLDGLEAEFVGEPVKYPYHFYTYDTNTLHGGKGALLPLTLEMVGLRHDITWDSWVEINPITAKQLNIRDGQLVWIESVVGRISAQAKVWPGVAPDVVAMPLGLGHEAFGRYAQGRGANPRAILAHARDKRVFAPARLATRVNVLPAD